MSTFMSRRNAVWKLAASFCVVAVSGVASAQQTQPDPPATLFESVRIFDGTSAALSAPSNVLIVGNKIERISTAAIAAPAGAAVIDGGGRTLMPGLIDAHWHSFSATPPLSEILTADVDYLHLVAGRTATETLMRGFTSVRDMGGPIFGLKRAIDEQVVPGPRVWPSGAAITQTGGHFDFRQRYEVPAAPNAPLPHMERIGAFVRADGPDAVRLRTRENLMLGASQIKLAAGGSVSGYYDPIDVTEYTEAEIRAAVEAAENWGTYVTVHVYTPRGMQMAIRAGVKCIEHGQLTDEATAALMAERGIWWSLQPFLADEDAFPFPAGSPNRAKELQVSRGTDTAYALAKRFKIKTAWGTDTLFSAWLATRQGEQLAKMVRWYTPAEVLKMATADNAELLALSGLRSPYPGKLGVVQEGALADLLLVDGNPLENISLIEDPAKNFLIIVKDGKIYKNHLR
jgi:imidazolonepropionase-like amidohydrolase